MVPFNFNEAKQHFGAVHEPIARGEMDVSAANLRIYTNFGLHYVAVIEKVKVSNEALDRARVEYLEAMDWMTSKEIYRAYQGDTTLMERIDEEGKEDAHSRIVRNFSRTKRLELKQVEIEDLFDYIKEPWSVDVGSKKGEKVSERAKPQRPTQDRIKRTGWVATDGTEYFLDMLTEDSALKRKLQANELLTFGGSSLHPAILRALAAGISLEDVAKHSGIPSEEIEEKLVTDYKNLGDSK